jgi:hypothetical protein
MAVVAGKRWVDGEKKGRELTDGGGGRKEMDKW